MSSAKYSIDKSRSIDEQVQSLIEQMMLDEKLAQLAGLWITAILDDKRQFAESLAQEKLRYGIGHISRISGTTYLPPQEVAKLANEVQRHLLEESRLGIPAIVHEESCAGFMARGASSFPQSIGLAATFEPELIEKMASFIKDQMRAVGAHHALAPVFDVVRDARWGRVEETYGEDPFLITAMGLAYVRGLQTENLNQGVAATGKHFAGHGLPEGGRNWAPVHINHRELHEIYLRPFKAAIKLGNIASMMNAYHEWDGVPIGASREMMIDILRHELGFDSVVVSDYYTLKTLVDYHHVAKDKSEAAMMGLKAGIDIELPFADCYADPLREALETGKISLELVEVSVARVLKLKIELGLFDNPYVDEGNVLTVFNQAEPIALSRTLAQKSMCLLKNENQILPLSKNLRSIAVIGPNADTIRGLQGDYHYPAHMLHIFEQILSADQPMPQGQNRVVANHNWNEHFPPSFSILEAIKAAVGEDTAVNYAQGSEVMGDDKTGFAEAIKIAKHADVAIVVLGDQSGLGRGSTVGESNDKAELSLPGSQQALLEAIHATGTPVILVCVAGRPYAITWADEYVPAILYAWFPAQEGGAAITDVLFGDVNPAGKLPMTFPRSAGQIPIFYNHKPSGGRSNWHTNYVDMSVKPLYPFGHGLSYTQFEYKGIALSHKEGKADDILEISVTLQNIGQIAGEEVVQLYVSDPVASVTRPVKILKGFKRLSLAPNEQKRICFKLDLRHLAFYNQDMHYVVEAGEIKLMIGSSSADIRLEDCFEIVEDAEIQEDVYLTEVAVETISLA
jgi:beta-glucosidase